MSVEIKVLLDSCSHPLRAPSIFQELDQSTPIPDQMLSRPIEMTTIANADLWMDEPHFCLLDQSGNVVNKYPHTPADHIAQHDIQPQHLPGKTLVLGAPGEWHYYHWMVDALPKLGLLEQAGETLESFDHFIFRNIAMDFHRQTLEAAGVSLSKVIEAKNHPRYICDELVDIRMSNLVGMTMPRFIPDYLKDVFLTDSTENHERHRRIYIGRPKSMKRRAVRNEEEVMNMLSVYGFSHYEMEDFSVKEQAKLFSEAEIVITPHGGALTNLVFCQPGCRVVELFANHVLSYFYGLANLCDLDYAAVLKNEDQYNLVVDPMAGNAMTNQAITSKEFSIPVNVTDLENAITGLGYTKKLSAA